MNGKAHYSENSTELMAISSSLCLNLLTHKYVLNFFQSGSEKETDKMDRNYLVKISSCICILQQKQISNNSIFGKTQNRKKKKKKKSPEKFLPPVMLTK